MHETDPRKAARIQARKEVRRRLVDLQKTLTEKRVQFHRAYQPIQVGKVKSRKTIRNCEDRWKIVRDTLDRYDARNMLDLGCAEGYFVRKAGELGYFSVGIDRDYNRLGLIESARMIDRSEKSAFTLSSIDPDLLARLPVFDVVLCFSIMHHIIRSNDLDYGIKCLSLMKNITRKAFLFDMGQTNEESTGWAKKLPYMGSDPKAWIREFLMGAGFPRCEVVAETDAYRDDVRRYVFRCTV